MEGVRVYGGKDLKKRYAARRRRRRKKKEEEEVTTKLSRHFSL